MTAVLSALFSGWWSRLFARKPTAEPAPARREHSPAPAEVPGPAVSVPAAAPTAAAATVAPAPTETPALTRMPFVPVSQPALRARTMTQLQQLQQIPALQSLAQGFLRAASRSDCSVEEVVAAVEKDPSLCVRVLRMANSAFVSSEQKIEDVFTAVQMLGLQRVNIMTHTLFMMRDARQQTGMDWRHLWIHAIATAAIADEIEKQLGQPVGRQLYLAALLHDVGKIVLSTVAPEAYRVIMDMAWANEGRFDALEDACFGLGHSDAGVVFAQHNGLPDETVAAIAHHANPGAATAHGLTVAVVSLANYFGKFYGLGFSGARLDETDGDLETQPGWEVIARETGVTPNIEAISDAVQVVVADLKHELMSLRDAA